MKEAPILSANCLPSFSDTSSWIYKSDLLPITQKIVSLAPGIKFNLGSHINHSIYWKNLCPIKNGGGALPADSALVKKIESQWGSFEKFKEDFINQIMKIQGSGWGNLAYNKTTKCLEYLETKDQDPVALKPNYVAILCIDGWEHAWYLQYMNVKKTYYNEIWKIINWKDLEQRYQEAIKNWIWDLLLKSINYIK